jgi:hypothetical protein
VLTKQYASAFVGTPLASMLTAQGEYGDVEAVATVIARLGGRP